MSRKLCLFLLFSIVLSSTVWILAQDGSGTKPLDLPISLGRGGEDDEDAPELILFYGAGFEGEAFFWCLDKSCSMAWGGAMQTLKREMGDALAQLSTSAEFGITAYSESVVSFAAGPAPATPSNKAAAEAWVEGLVPGGGTCMAAGGTACLQIANQSVRDHRRVLVLGDGVPACGGSTDAEGTLAAITGANYQQIPIDTLYISADDAGIAFMQQLAALNNGTFTLVD